MPETERTMELSMPASAIAVAPSGRQMAVAAADGCVTLHSLPDMTTQARWPRTHVHVRVCVCVRVRVCVRVYMCGLHVS
jgi:hypothetical protein